MEPAQSSETTMSERPYLTFRSASRRARGRGMARVATRRRARRCVVVMKDGRPETSRLGRCSRLVTPEASDLNLAVIMLLAWQLSLDPGLT